MYGVPVLFVGANFMTSSRMTVDGRPILLADRSMTCTFIIGFGRQQGDLIGDGGRLIVCKVSEKVFSVSNERADGYLASILHMVYVSSSGRPLRPLISSPATTFVTSDLYTIANWYGHKPWTEHNICHCQSAFGTHARLFNVFCQ